MSNLFLLGPRHRLSHEPEPNCQGLYALFLKKGATLDGVEVPPDDPIYFGKCESGFESRGHVSARDSSGSTFRRSLGALLRDSGRIVCDVHPRRSRGQFNERSYHNFRFSEDGEVELRKWMLENLEYSFQPVKDQLADAEKKWIRELNPPLNIQHCRNELREKLLKLRKMCAIEAQKRGRGEC